MEYIQGQVLPPNITWKDISRAEPRYDNIPGFHGSIKTNIGDLTKLTHLMIYNNPLLTGTLPSELGLCDELSESCAAIHVRMHLLII